MLLNLCLAWGIPYLIIVGYEMLNPVGTKIPDKPIAHLLASIREVVLMLSGIFYYVSSAFIGAFVAFYILKPATVFTGRVEACIGIIAGIWVLAIFLQFSLNFVREYLGVPKQPIIWINKRLLALGRRRARRDKDDSSRAPRE